MLELVESRQAGLHTHLFCLRFPSLLKLWGKMVLEEMMVRAALVKKFWTRVSGSSLAALCDDAYLYNLVHLLVVFVVRLRHLVGAAHHLATVVGSAVAVGSKV